MGTRTNTSLLILLPLLLTIFGIFMIFEASSISAGRIYGDAFHFVRQQVLWFGASVIVLFIMSRFDYHRLYQFALPLLVVNIVLLLLVFVPGLSTTVLGARRWLKIGPATLQPSEFTKFTLVVYLSAWFSFKERSRFFAFIVLTGFIILLVMLQPNLSTASLLAATAGFLYILSGPPLKHILITIGLGFTSLLALAFTSTYRLKRIITFLNPAHDVQGIGYHINQINIALSLGGIFGVGFGASKQKFQFLPEAHTDSIFAIIGENFGFIGALLIMLLYGIFLYLIYQQIRASRDRLGFLLASGIFFIIGIQTIVNLGAMVQILPLTGIPLPYLSYGGSSLITFYALLGILVNISRYNAHGKSATTRRQRR